MPGPKPYIIGICGGSASGKTFLLNQLLNQFTEDQVTLVSQDNYYRPLEDQHRDEEGLVNFDHPDSVDLDKLHTDLKALMEGKTLHIKEYTFNNPKVHARTLELRPNPIILVEGLFVYYRQDLAQLIDLKVFVEADEHVKLTRRLRRDHTERGYTIESILRDYDKFVAPMYHRYVAPSKQIADLIVLNNRRMYKAIQVLVHHLHSILAEKT